MEQARKQQVVARGRVRSINVSKRKGTRKTPCEGGATVVAHRGLDTDAHAGDWHRQVSLLAWESIEKARATGLDVVEGDFAENVTTEGIDLLALPLGTRVRIGEDVLLELSQIGKVCHTKCAIYHLAGDCIFPREGIFFVALEGGAINVGDPVEVVSLGDGTCAYTPPEALAELAAARGRRRGGAKRPAHAPAGRISDAPVGVVSQRGALRRPRLAGSRRRSVLRYANLRDRGKIGRRSAPQRRGFPAAARPTEPTAP